MFSLIKDPLLGILRVPSEPQPPIGETGTLLTFRAAPNYFRYRLVVWAIGQMFTLLGLIALVTVSVASVIAGNPQGWLTALFLFIAAFLVLQATLSFLIVRLDYELRWYLVTDQCLRIREGVFFVREMTMTFANIQNISISQGPLQRLLGVADLKVQSAGGGGSATQKDQKHQLFEMHTGYFRGVDNAEQLRDLMRERLRQARDSGLGDPDDHHADTPAPTLDLQPVLAELRAEAGALRRCAEAME